MKWCEIAVGIESRKRRWKRSGFPISNTWHTHTGVNRRGGHRHKVEIVLPAFEGFVGKNRLHCNCGMTIEAVHLSHGVTLGKDSYINRFWRVTALMNIAMGRQLFPILIYHKYVGRIETMRHWSHRGMTVVKKLNCYIDRVLGERHKHSMLKSLRRRCSLLCGKPFMIKGWKWCTIDSVARSDGTHGDYSSTLER